MSKKKVTNTPAPKKDDCFTKALKMYQAFTQSNPNFMNEIMGSGYDDSGCYSSDYDEDD